MRPTLRFWALGSLACVVPLAVWALSDVKRGDVDPVSTMVGTLALIATLASLAFTVADQRRREADPRLVAEQIVRSVLKSEGAAWAAVQGERPTPIDVRFVLRSAPERRPEGAEPEGRLEKITEYFGALRHHRLVITGGPGAGKTVLAQKLLLDLCRDRADGAFVPIRLSLSGWTELVVDDIEGNDDRGGEAVRAWLLRALVETYGITRRSAEALVDTGYLLPMFDGLDEMDGSTRARPVYQTRARQALAALGRYAPNGVPLPMVVTCRTELYQELQGVDVRADFAACVEITSVSPVQARTFIIDRSSRVGRWDGVLDCFAHRPSEPLARYLATPWRLAVAIHVYEHRDSAGGYPHDPGELLRPALADPNALGEHLHRLFVTRALDHQVWHNRGDAPRIRDWLGNIAWYLNTNGSTGRTLGGRVLPTGDVVPHELWLMGDTARILRWHRIFAILSVLAVSTSAAIVASPGWPWQAALVVWPLLLLAVYGGFGSRIWPTAVVTHRRAVRHAVSGVMFACLIGAVPFLVFGFDAIVVVALFGGAGLWAMGSALLVDPETVVSPSGVISRSTGHAAAAAVYTGAFLGLVGGWAYGFYRGTAMVYAFGVVLGFATFVSGASLGIRRLALHATARHPAPQLPWRISSDLDRAEQCGLLRIAGDVYQFRHRELQDWFADRRNTL